MYSTMIISLTNNFSYVWNYSEFQSWFAVVKFRVKKFETRCYTHCNVIAVFASKRCVLHWKFWAWYVVIISLLLCKVAYFASLSGMLSSCRYRGTKCREFHRLLKKCLPFSHMYWLIIFYLHVHQDRLVAFVNSKHVAFGNEDYLSSGLPNILCMLCEKACGHHTFC